MKDARHRAARMVRYVDIGGFSIAERLLNWSWGPEYSESKLQESEGGVDYQVAPAMSRRIITRTVFRRRAGG
jgi:hypothetical protein